MVAQMNTVDEDSNTFIICPNTVISIGTAEDPAAENYNFIGGDFPLSIVRENVTIQCGLDGSRNNNCVLDGGFIQVLLLGKLVGPDGYLDYTGSIDHLVIRGLTFTGRITNSGPFPGNSVVVSNSGKDVRFEDCVWRNMSISHGLIGVSQNIFETYQTEQEWELPIQDQSIDLTFSECLFEDLIYDSPIIHVERQNVTLERCIFRKIEVTALIQKDCNAGVHFDVPLTEGCAGLLYCGFNSTCSVKDVCVESLEYFGPGAVYMTEDTIAASTIENIYADDISWDCELAVAREDDGSVYDCVKIFTEQACPI